MYINTQKNGVYVINVATQKTETRGLHSFQLHNLIQINLINSYTSTFISVRVVYSII